MQEPSFIISPCHQYSAYLNKEKSSAPCCSTGPELAKLISLLYQIFSEKYILCEDREPLISKDKDLSSKKTIGLSSCIQTPCEENGNTTLEGILIGLRTNLSQSPIV